MAGLQEAIALAERYHRGQYRKSGEPYIAHPMRVMRFLEKHNFPEEALIAAVLHDVCEDSKLSNVEMSQLFGTRVGFVVNALSKNRKPKRTEQLKQEYEARKDKRRVSDLERYNNFDEYVDYRCHLYINRIYTGIMADPRVFFIKIADKIDNISDMEAFSPAKRQKKIQELEQHFVPIYQKSESIFSLNTETFTEYQTFFRSLHTALQQAKTLYAL